jgi:hypothetical protein
VKIKIINMAPQIIYLALVGINLLLTANLHGKERSNYNFWITLVGTFLGLGLLYWGGFFQ